MFIITISVTKVLITTMISFWIYPNKDVEWIASKKWSYSNGQNILEPCKILEKFRFSTRKALVDMT